MIHTGFNSWNFSRIMLVSARLHFLASQYLSLVVMTSDKLAELDTEGFVEEQPNIIFEESQHSHSEYEPSPTGPTYDLSAEAFRLEDIIEGSRKSAVIINLDQIMASFVNSEWQTLVPALCTFLGSRALLLGHWGTATNYLPFVILCLLRYLLSLRSLRKQKVLSRRPRSRSRLLPFQVDGKLMLLVWHR